MSRVQSSCAGPGDSISSFECLGAPLHSINRPSYGDRVRHRSFLNLPISCGVPLYFLSCASSVVRLMSEPTSEPKVSRTSTSWNPVAPLNVMRRPWLLPLLGHSPVATAARQNNVQQAARGNGILAH